MTTPSLVRDANESTFPAAVIERSRTLPVVVDFWAPWCGPCRTLGPALERLVSSLDGQVELVKVNTDENPYLAQQYRIEGIPAVKAFRNGAVISEFTGALPEPQVRAFLNRLLPTSADQLATTAATLAYAGDLAGAEAAYRRALEEDRGHRAANIGLARLLAARGETAGAIALLANLPADPEAIRLRAELSLQQGSADLNVQAFEERLASNQGDVEAHYRLAQALAAGGAYEAALEHLLEVVRRDRGFENDAGRKSMLDIFAVLGDADPLTQAYRRRLSSILF